MLDLRCDAKTAYIGPTCGSRLLYERQKISPVLHCFTQANSAVGRWRPAVQLVPDFRCNCPKLHESLGNRAVVYGNTGISQVGIGGLISPRGSEAAARDGIGILRRLNYPRRPPIFIHTFPTGKSCVSGSKPVQ